ncbi:MAG: MurR/RpiR family transcriptional regulator [Nitrososphaerales archaeon]
MTIQALLEPKTLLERLQRDVLYLNPALRRVGEYILEHPEESKTLSISRLATSCGVAESTVTRFVREVGLRSYQDLKIGLAEALTRHELADTPRAEPRLYEGLSPTDSVSTILDKVAYHNIQALTDTKRQLNLSEVVRAVEAIERANLVLFSCMGSSSLAAEEGLMRFSRAGKKCWLFRDQNFQLLTSAIVDPGNVVIAISNSGRSRAVVECARLAQERGAETIAITSFQNSPLTRYASIKLYTPTRSASLATGVDWDPTTAKTAQMLVIDALYACYAARHLDQTVCYLEITAEALKDSRIR